MAEHIENLDAELEEAKATGEDSMAADATTPAGGSNTKRKADKNVAAEKPHKQGSSDEKTPMGPNNVGMKEGIEVLFDGEELSEAFKEKTTAIFEAAVHERVEAHKAQLEEKFDADLQEQTQIIIDELVEKVDSYLDYVVSEWVKDNEVAIESNIKVEVAESLLGGVVNLVKEHNLEMTDEAVDAVKIAEQRAEEMSEKYNEVVAELIEAKKEMAENARKQVFETVSEGLADTQVEKLRVLSEGLSFVDADDYSRKLSVIKESYFKVESVEAGEDLAETLLEEVEESEEAKAPAIDPQIAAYVNALARTTK
jgi:hypothetical protein